MISDIFLIQKVVDKIKKEKKPKAILFPYFDINGVLKVGFDYTINRFEIFKTIKWKQKVPDYKNNTIQEQGVKNIEKLFLDLNAQRMFFPKDEIGFPLYSISPQRQNWMHLCYISLQEAEEKAKKVLKEKLENLKKEASAVGHRMKNAWNWRKIPCKIQEILLELKYKVKRFTLGLSGEFSALVVALVSKDYTKVLKECTKIKKLFLPQKEGKWR